MIPTKIVCLSLLLQLMGSTFVGGSCHQWQKLLQESHASVRIRLVGVPNSLRVLLLIFYEELAENRQELKNLHEPSPSWPFPDLSCPKP